ncbi:dUTP diphosphatase [Bacillus velezensis]|uniref:dUTP diphosphatase n=1 Tax=Bacillus velezensis TaxID=492670 RepID=UPI003396C00D
MNVNIKRLSPDAQIPDYAHATDAGFDLVASEDVIIEPGETACVPTGLAFEIPKGYEMQIRPRFGITLNTPLRVQLGTVDAGYRGEVGVIVDNIGQKIDEETTFYKLVDGHWGTLKRGFSISSSTIIVMEACLFRKIRAKFAKEIASRKR